jgi:hypothetical protein
MSFYEDNKFFIIQKLQVDMAGLSEKEKLEKYEVIKPSVRERIYNSHPKKDSITEDDNVIELKKFYDELFEHIGEFDFNYILSNLFFENRVTQIAHFLKNNSKYFNDLSNNSSLDKFSSLFLEFIELNDSFPNTFLKFLINSICESTSLSILDLEYGDSDLGFSSKYPKWLIENLCIQNDIKNIMFIHLTVIRYLNIKNLFIGHEFSNRSAIQFIHYLNESYDVSINAGESPNIYNFRLRLTTFLNELFIRDYIVKSPILTSQGAHLSNGFYIQRTRFLDRIDQAEILNNDMSNEEYSYLFESLLSCSDERLKNKIILEIKNKIKLFDYPDGLEFMEINKLRENSLFIDSLFKTRFYLFEL